MTIATPSLDLIRTTNPLLAETLTCIGQYNKLPPAAGGTGANQQRLDLLNRIVLAAGSYLTSKPPQDKPKNKARWAGLKTILEQVSKEMLAIGGRMLKGPADFQAITCNDHSYWLEVLDPAHRAASTLSMMFQVWSTRTESIEAKQSFWNYMGTAAPQVHYCSDDERAKYVVGFDDKGLMVDSHGDPFSTEHMETHFSGEGWAIFVVDTQGTIYSATHAVNAFHHSSFLQGRPVMAAGEIVVQDGVVKAITAKSGHYRPTVDNMLEFVRTARTLPWNAMIRADMKDTDPATPGGAPRPAVFQRLGDFRARGHTGAAPLKRATVLGELPAWAKQAKAMSQLGLIAP